MCDSSQDLGTVRGDMDLHLNCSKMAHESLGRVDDKEHKLTASLVEKNSRTYL